MNSGEAFSEAMGDLQGLLFGQRAFFNELFEGLTLDIGEHDVGYGLEAVAVNGHDAGVFQLTRDLGFFHKSLNDFLSVHALERDRYAEWLKHA